MSASLRVAIVGAGLMGRWHAFYAARAGGSIEAIVDPDPARREALSLREARGYDDLPTCLAGEELDVVHVCTPTATHEPLARAALNAGVHALVEKPLAGSSAQTASLLALARAGGVQLAPVHQFPFQRGVRRVRGDLSELGRLVEASYVTSSAGGVGRDDAARRELLFEILPHPLSLFAALPGVELEEVSWRTAVSTADDLEVHGEWEGLLLRARLGLRGRPTRNELSLVGERATAHLDLFHGFGVIVGGRSPSRATKLALPFQHGGKLVLSAGANAARRAVSREPAYPGLRELIAAFYAAVRGEAPPPIDPAEVGAIAAVVDRLRQPGDLAGDP